jgi:hypothetical protein
MKLRTLVPLSFLALPLVASGEAPAVNPNIGHTHHHHSHHGKLPTEAARPERFVTSREGAAALLLPVEKDAFQFAVFGDRTGGPPEGVAVLADAVRDVNLLAPDLVMTVGDLIQGYNDGKDWIPQAVEYKEVMEHLVCPWFRVAGNHDVYWRGNDPTRKPPGEHEKLYETHFGPLWYAFAHKGSWFIVLYSDEGNPETGVKDFKDPASQRMSAEQFDWLRQTLVKAKDANHVFVFLHHPRWIKDNGKPRYGDDWQRVHALLKEAGNVSAVFGGHIHQMRSEGPIDGIEYITLATTGGHMPGSAESFGYLHHYDVVTVRKDSFALAAIPVGKVLDPREMTGDLIAETQKFALQAIRPTPSLTLAADGSASSVFNVELSNPTSRPIDFTLTADSADSRWTFRPDHRHGTIAPGAKETLEFTGARLASPLDVSFRDPVLTLEADYLAKGYRYKIPPRVIKVPVSFASADRATAGNQALKFDGKRDYLLVSSEAFDPGERLTLECRFKADSFENRTGLVTKTQNSDYGIFINNGRPAFSVLVGDAYLTARADGPVLEAGAWHHLAGVYDGAEARLYLDGKLIASKAGKGIRRRNTLPLAIGGDVDGAHTATSLFTGLIDYVRVSTVPRYEGTSVTVPDRPLNDADTCLLLHLDEMIGLRLPDDSASGAHAERSGNPVLVPLQW